MPNSVQPFPNSSDNFNKDAAKFKCCCGCMHSRVATMIMTILEIVSYMGFSIFFIYLMYYWPLLVAGVALGSTLFHLLIMAMALYGAAKEKSPCFLIPYAVLQTLAILACACWAILWSVILLIATNKGREAIFTERHIGYYRNDSLSSYFNYSSMSQYEYNAEMKSEDVDYVKRSVVYSWLIEVLPTVIIFIYKMWSLIVVSKCCHYLRLKRKSRRIGVSAMHIRNHQSVIRMRQLKTDNMMNLSNQSDPISQPYDAADIGYGLAND